MENFPYFIFFSKMNNKYIKVIKAYNYNSHDINYVNS